ncbi:M60 family metallopeptidase [Sphingobacterium anhuiense]|uniref:M60 family metallopeptidase n=1 Tax=Sphingobacterium anhuiense TaxID=493780 RepID=UPI003C2CB2D0
MKLKQFTALLSMTMLLAVTSCSKYGYNIPDGYPDNSKNTADGVIDTNMKLIDKTMYAKARVFPGLVDIEEPRVVDAKFTLDLNFTKQTTLNLKISVAPEPQFSTGYYAAPGELIKIVVPQGIEGLSVQIGGHTDNLTGKSPLLRDPVIYMRQQLFPGANFVRNLYGGTIYIRPDRAYPNPVEFTITNACVSPDYVLGESNNDQWIEKVKASKVPWLELRTKRVVFLIPRDRVIKSFTSSEPFVNPQAVMTKWNDVFELDFNGWMGLSDNAEDERDRSPQGPWRGVLDIQLTNGYGHNGFPFVGYNDSEWFGGMTSLKAISTSDGMWGSYHEFGHNCQQGSMWSWSTLGETTNNLFNFKVANRIGANYSVLHPAVNSGFPEAIAYASKEGLKNFDTDAAMADAFKRMTPFVQIFEQFGYGAMTHLYKEARKATRYNPSDITKHNWVLEKLSEYTNTNLSPFFEAWGITHSPQLAARLKEKHQRLTKKIWTYNPLTKTGGQELIPTKVDYNRADWAIAGFSTEEPGEGADPAGRAKAVLDGKIETFWHSQWNGSSPPPPHHIILDMKQNLKVSGFYFYARQDSPNGRSKKVEILVSSNNTTWTNIGTYDLQNVTARQEVLLSKIYEFRYVRFNFNEPTNYAGGVHATMAEIGAFYDEKYEK